MHDEHELKDIVDVLLRKSRAGGVIWQQRSDNSFSVTLPYPFGVVVSVKKTENDEIEFSLIRVPNETMGSIKVKSEHPLYSSLNELLATAKWFCSNASFCDRCIFKSI